MATSTTVTICSFNAVSAIRTGLVPIFIRGVIPLEIMKRIRFFGGFVAAIVLGTSEGGDDGRHVGALRSAFRLTFRLVRVACLEVFVARFFRVGRVGAAAAAGANAHC